MRLSAQLGSTSLLFLGFPSLGLLVICKTFGEIPNQPLICHAWYLACQTISVSPTFLHLLASPVNNTNTLFSLPRSKRTSWPWQRGHHYRAPRQVHNKGHHEMPTRRHH